MKTLWYTDTPKAKHTCTQNNDAIMGDLIVKLVKRKGGREVF